MTFATEEDANRFGLYTWKQFVNILPDTCASKTATCGNTYTCAICKLNKEDEMYSPMGDQAQGTAQLDHMLNALLDANRKYHWVTSTTYETLQALSDLFAEQAISAQVRDGLSNWEKWWCAKATGDSYALHQPAITVTKSLPKSRASNTSITQ